MEEVRAHWGLFYICPHCGDLMKVNPADNTVELCTGEVCKLILPDPGDIDREVDFELFASKDKYDA